MVHVTSYVKGGISIVGILTTSITAQVSNAIRDAIVNGEYEPGQKLSEITLSEYYQVSRTPIREALKQLEREGLVEIIPRVGTCVAKPTEKELKELFRVKEVLEGLAAGLLAENRNRDIINHLQSTINGMEKAIQESNNKLYVHANTTFHQAILTGADNSKLSYLLNLLLNQIPYNRYVYLTIENPKRLENSLNEHKAILSAIEKGNREQAERAMRDHVKASGLQLENTGVS
ncbi:GntR family transcriptional regulator [Metabacillus schmidteae]|uniref:GntR family transcriptional regulator n=1 Tax=Metabacillus schmidteae TaxID=2730405 RepID=UPI00158B7F35|nr:GntR family transcriptional regulator [Metabacillus schmidteae]